MVFEQLAHDLDLLCNAHVDEADNARMRQPAHENQFAEILVLGNENRRSSRASASSASSVASVHPCCPATFVRGSSIYPFCCFAAHCRIRATLLSIPNTPTVSTRRYARTYRIAKGYNCAAAINPLILPPVAAYGTAPGGKYPITLPHAAAAMEASSPPPGGRMNAPAISTIHDTLSPQLGASPVTGRYAIVGTKPLVTSSVISTIRAVGLARCATRPANVLPHHCTGSLPHSRFARKRMAMITPAVATTITHTMVATAGIPANRPNTPTSTVSHHVHSENGTDRTATITSNGLHSLGSSSPPGRDRTKFGHPNAKIAPSTNHIPTRMTPITAPAAATLS